MRLGIGIPNTAKRLTNASPSYVDTLSVDYPIQALKFAGGFNVTLGTLFTTTSSGVCTGIRIRCGTAVPLVPLSLTFALYAFGGAPLGNETIAFNPTMFGQIVQTTVAFPSVLLASASQFVAALWMDGPNSPYNWSPLVPAGYLPKSYPKYTVNVGVQVAVGVGLNYPSINDPLYATYIEPIIV